MKLLSGRYAVQVLERMPYRCIKTQKKRQAIRLPQRKITAADGMEVSWEE